METPQELVEMLLEGEVFRFMDLKFDIDEAYKLIKAGQVKAVLKDWNIEQYAKEVLALDRNHPDRIPKSIFIRINAEHVQELPDDRVEEPGIVAVARLNGTPFTFVIDGNHRLVKRYLSGLNTMRMYVIDDPKESEKFAVNRMPTGKLKLKTVPKETTTKSAEPVAV